MFFPPDGLEKALTAPSPQSQFQCELPSEDAVPSYTECGQKGHNATAESKFSFSYVTPQRFQQRTRPAMLLANRL
jgi:hypothetical protein